MNSGNRSLEGKIHSASGASGLDRTSGSTKDLKPELQHLTWAEQNQNWTVTW